MNYQVLVQQGYQLFAAEHSSCCCQNCKRAAPPTLYVHILVIAGSSFFYCPLLLFPLGCPFSCPRCVWVVLPRHILVVPIHSVGFWNLGALLVLLEIPL
jgi:hypothetical protein